jgi:hypothetical protein
MKQPSYLRRGGHVGALAPFRNLNRAILLLLNNTKGSVRYIVQSVCVAVDVATGPASDVNETTTVASMGNRDNRVVTVALVSHQCHRTCGRVHGGTYKCAGVLALELG